MEQLNLFYKATKISSLPLRERPDNRVITNAVDCNLVELFSAIIGGVHQLEIAEKLVEHFHGDARAIYKASTDELLTIKGIGKASAVRLKAALVLGNRLHEPVDLGKTITSPEDAADFVINDMRLLEQEYLKVILLDTRNHVTEIDEVYHGSVNSSLVRVSEVLRPAIQRNMPSIIMVHNHPSGDPTPSPEDVSITKAVSSAGKLLDISLLDHLVIGINGFRSLKAAGLII